MCRVQGRIDQLPSLTGALDPDLYHVFVKKYPAYTESGHQDSHGGVAFCRSS